MRGFAEHTVPAATAIVLSGAMAGAAAAQEIARECHARVDGNAIEHTHTDLGDGLVGWFWSWTAEGVADDMIVAECESGRRLTARARSERMTETIPYDRRRPAMREVLQMTDPGARAFFSLERLATALEGANVPSEITETTDETCACAAFYPDLRGTKRPFDG